MQVVLTTTFFVEFFTVEIDFPETGPKGYVLSTKQANKKGESPPL